MSDSPRFLTPAECGKRLGICSDKVRRFIHDGLLEAVDVSHTDNPRFRIPPEALAAFVESRTVKPDAPAKRRKAEHETVEQFV